MKVIFLTGSLEAGGLERFVTRVSCYAADKKVFEPAVICLNRRSGIFLDQLTRGGVSVYEAPKGWQRRLRALSRLGKMIREMQADVVHSQVNFSLVQQWLATRVLGQTKFLVTERNMYPLAGMALWRRRLQFYFLKMVGVAYSVNSKEVANHLSKLLWYPSGGFKVIANGVEIPSVSKVIVGGIRLRYGWSPDDVVIGYVSRMTAHKGQFYFLRILKNLVAMKMPVKGCLVGDGPDRPALEKWVEENQLTPFVSFTGIISNMAEMTESFDICALLSEYEGMPNVVIEAMACGKAVIAHPVGNVLELFEGGAGVAVAPNNMNMALESFKSLIQDADKRKKIGDAARRRISKQFSIESTIENLMTQYKS